MSAVNPIEDNVARLVSFIVEREAIRFRRANNLPMDNLPDGEGGYYPVWTEDPILREYRFCNVHREDDTVTMWIAENIRKTYKDVPDLWHLLTLARLFNNVETLDAMLNNAIAGYALGKPFYVSARSTAKRMQKAKRRIFNPAYMITTAGRKQDKIDYIFELLENLWEQRERLRPQPGNTLNSYHMLLGQFQGLGSFLTAQVVADLKYVEPLKSASDWHTFAASGPGSRRGLNRILGRSVKSPWSEDDWRQKLNKLQVATAVHLKRAGIVLHAQDLQSALCEWDKYERARLGEGRPKQRYRHG